MWIIKSVKNKMRNDLNIGEYGGKKVKKKKRKKTLSAILFHLSPGYFLMPALSERQVI